MAEAVRVFPIKKRDTETVSRARSQTTALAAPGNTRKQIWVSGVGRNVIMPSRTADRENGLMGKGWAF